MTGEDHGTGLAPHTEAGLPGEPGARPHIAIVAFYFPPSLSLIHI